MNYGISILFQGYPIADGPFCFGYGTFVYSTWGRTRTDSLRGPWSSL